MGVASAVLILIMGTLIQYKGRKGKNKMQLMLGTIITTAATIYLIANLVFISSIK